MQPYVLSCCSTADLSRDHFVEREIAYACFHFIMAGKQYADDLGESMPFETFYQKIAEGEAPTTAQVNVAEFKAFFTPFLEAGQDILHVSLSSGISGAFNAANVARNELLQSFPNRKITIVDSRGASSGYGLLMDMLADQRDSGASYEEAVDYAETMKLHIHHWFFSTDLTAYIRGGRISKAAGFFGSLLGVCPLLNMDEAGHLIPRDKIRTKRKVKQAILERMIEHAKDGLAYSGKCYISQSACYDDAKDVADAIEATFPKLNGKAEINYVGTTIGAHTGCGTVALFFVGDLRKD